MQKTLRRTQAKYTLFSILLSVIILWLAQAWVRAETVHIAWDYDFTTNGDVVKFNVYQSGVSGQYELGLDYAIKNIDSTKDNPVLTTSIDVPIGHWYYVVTASDANENISDASNEVFYTVEPPDTIPPTLTMPENLSVAAVDENGKIVQYSVSVSDDRDPNPVVECVPLSGSLFPIGTTTVECSVTDNSGNSAHGNFTVTVIDVIPPSPPINLRITLDSEFNLPAGEYEISFSQIGDSANGGISFASGEYELSLRRVNEQNVTIIFPESYQVAILKTGDRYLLDRPYTIISFPEGFGGAEWILPLNDDKISTSENHLSFAIKRPSVVYIAYDHRAVVIPDWLTSYEYTGEIIEVSDEVQWLELYKKDFPPGEIILGGNKAAGNEFPTLGGGTNYLVIVVG